MRQTKHGDKAPSGEGVVVTYAPNDSGFSDTHEKATHERIARSLAALKGFDFIGNYDPTVHYDCPIYFLPNDTIIGAETASQLGMKNQHDLFGGIVPHPFVATKAITHPLVAPNAFAPIGWSHEFDARVHDAVPFGFTAFTIEDAFQAVSRLLQYGPARLKPVRANAGRGQVVISRTADVEALLQAVDADELSTFGLVLEENLTDVETYSVGQVVVADLVVSYYGTQTTTPDNNGEEVYGGSDLMVVRGDFQTLLGLELPEELRRAVMQACVYDAAASELFPGLMASRRNYDVVSGVASSGRRRTGVLEQSWRMGGASTAEIVALEAFRADPALLKAKASSVEIYGESEAPPSQATIYFRGVDERVGFLTKYAAVEPVR